MRLARRTALKTGVAWCAVGRLAGAQLPGVAVDPHIVVLSPARPGGEITVFNPRPFPAEFSLDLRFGYVTTDSSGSPRVELKDGPDSVSAAEWITPYPRRFMLEPGASQLVRLLARPPAGVVDGEYWARLTVHSQDITGSRSATGITEPGTNRVALMLETATVIPIFFRKGHVATGVSIDDIRATSDSDGIDAHMSLRRTGNAAFLGIAHLATLDADGHELTSTDRQIAVYIASATRWRVQMPAQLRSRVHTLSVVFSTQRHDVPGALIVQSQPVHRQISLKLP